MKSLVILGSTGSIGESALELVAADPTRWRVVGLAARRDVDRLLAQARRFGVGRIAVAEEGAAAEARHRLPAGTTLLAGEDGVAELAAATPADIVLCALVGMAGLRPVLAALEAGRRLALATKEVLAAAGEIVMRERARRGVPLLPVDSEHSAIFQCLQSSAFVPACVRDVAAADAPAAESRVRRLLLTASGGPFARRPEADLRRVTVADALRHPRWRMGRKISVDSATMMNKGLEILEARWLFNLPPAAIEVVVHPESVVHSLVEFVDGAVLAQLAPPDMRYAIHYALSWPDRLPAALPSLDLVALARLHFGAPDTRRFPALRLARAAAEAGGTMPAVLNAANEAAVEAFLAGRLGFAAIWECVEAVLEAHAVAADPTLEAILAADAWARREAARHIAAH